MLLCTPMLGLFFGGKDMLKIFMISGKARHGKDTAGSFLRTYYENRGYKCCTMHLSTPLKEYAEHYFGWDPKTEEKPRELLQKLGQEIIREDLQKPYFLINRLTEDIEILSHFFQVFLVTDVRLPLEIDTIKKRFSDVVSIHIVRPNFETKELTEEENQHVTEHALESYTGFDYQITNLTLEKLDKDMESIIRKEESKNENNDINRN